MPKRAMILLAAISLGLAVASCSKSTNPATPTPAPSSSSTPIPTDKTATVKVTVLGTPTAGIPVAISTPKSLKNPHPGTPFQTRKTDATGIVKFKNLTVSDTYCWVATLPGSQTPAPTSQTCASWEIWQTTTIPIGTP